MARRSAKDDIILCFSHSPPLYPIGYAASRIRDHLYPATADLKHDWDNPADIDQNNSTFNISMPSTVIEEGNIAQIANIIRRANIAASFNSRLTDILIPKSHLSHIQGPEFGKHGIKKLFKDRKGPFSSTIIPFHASNEEHAKIVYQSLLGGIDIALDSDMQYSTNTNDFRKRVYFGMAKAKKAQDATGQKKFYFPNITADPLEMIERAKIVKDNGGKGVVIDTASAGAPAIASLKKAVSRLMIYAMNSSQMASYMDYNSAPNTRMCDLKLNHLAGADIISFNMLMDEHRHSASHARQKDDIAFINSYISKRKSPKPPMMAFSGDIFPHNSAYIAKLAGPDCIINYDKAVHDHPSGPLGGAKAVSEALRTIDNPSRTQSIELRKAYEKWA